MASPTTPHARDSKMPRWFRRLQCRALGHKAGPCIYDIDLNVGIVIHEHFCSRCGTILLKQVGTAAVAGDPRLFGQGDPESPPKTTTYIN